MPAPIAQLYRLTERDRAFPNWGPSFGQIEREETATTVTTTLAEWDASSRPVQGTCLFVTNIAIVADADGVNDIVTLVEARVMNRLTGNVVTSLLIEHGTNPARLRNQSQFDFALPLERYYLDVTSEYPSAVILHRVQLNWTGFVVPIGVIGFF